MKEVVSREKVKPLSIETVVVLRCYVVLASSQYSKLMTYNI
jgi:hypothetical protein